MTRRHLTLTIDITLDEDLVQLDTIPPFTPDGDSNYDDTLNLLRTAIQHDAATILNRYSPAFGNPTIEYHGIHHHT